MKAYVLLELDYWFIFFGSYFSSYMLGFSRLRGRGAFLGGKGERRKTQSLGL